jgi:hypothetical protein
MCRTLLPALVHEWSVDVSEEKMREILRVYIGGGPEYDQNLFYLEKWA